jgi:hypothetical protein
MPHELEGVETLSGPHLQSLQAAAIVEWVVAPDINVARECLQVTAHESGIMNPVD